MNPDNSLGLLFVLSTVFIFSALVTQSRLSHDVKLWVIVGAWLRVIGAVGYFYFVSSYYGGGDYSLYYKAGLRYAEVLQGAAWDTNFDSRLGGRWWGTAFVIRVSGILLSAIGPTMIGAFIAFAMLGYIGLLGLAAAFHRAFPGENTPRYLKWLVTFPSLWFWPAALGKDALLLTGIGVAVFGFVGKRGRTGWLTLAAGLLIVFAVRPQVAAVLTVALLISHWFSATKGFTLARVLQGLVLCVIGVGVLAMSSRALGTSLFSPEEISSYLGGTSSVSSRGGSAIIDESAAAISFWRGPVNVLLRPFPWEARGITAMAAALEIFFLWWIAIRYRRGIYAFAMMHVRSKLMWCALVFFCMYALTLGLALGNLGIIARQRVHLYPFLFIFFAAASYRERRRPHQRATIVPNEAARHLRWS